MTHEELVSYCLGKPGAVPELRELVDASYDAVVGKLPRRLRPA